MFALPRLITPRCRGFFMKKELHFPFGCDIYVTRSDVYVTTKGRFGMSRYTNKYFGYIGFLGFLGFRYFVTGRITDLCLFGFFAFFAYFWIAKLNVSIPDERYRENVETAKAFIGNLAVIEMAVLFVLSVLFSRFQELLVFGITIAYASLIIGYAVRLYQLEER